MLPMPMWSVRRTTVRKVSAKKTQKYSKCIPLVEWRACGSQVSPQDPLHIQSSTVSTTVFCPEDSTGSSPTHFNSNGLHIWFLGRRLLIKKQILPMLHYSLDLWELKLSKVYMIIFIFDFKDTFLFKPRSKTASTWIVSQLSFKVIRAKFHFPNMESTFSVSFCCVTSIRRARVTESANRSLFFFPFIDQPASMYEDKVQLICKKKKK